MKQVYGWWLPDSEMHLPTCIKTMSGEYQIDHRNLSLSYVDKFNVAIDIGANVGLWAKDLCKRFKHVYLFEPLDVHIECLLKNLKDFDNFTLYQYALGNKESFTHIKPVTELSNSRVVDIQDSYSHIYNIKMQTLDSFGIENADYIKLDVEGYEFPVLEGGINTMNGNPILNIELKPFDFGHNISLDETRQFLTNAKYKCIDSFQDDYIFQRII